MYVVPMTYMHGCYILACSSVSETVVHQNVAFALNFDHY